MLKKNTILNKNKGNNKDFKFSLNDLYPEAYL